MTKVLVVQEQPHLDFGDAERWGEVRFLTASEFRPQRNSLINDQILANVRMGIARSFNAFEDWLVLAGNPIVIGYAMHAAMETARSQEASNVGILHYDRKFEGYREAAVPIDPIITN